MEFERGLLWHFFDFTPQKPEKDGFLNEKTHQNPRNWCLSSGFDAPEILLTPRQQNFSSKFEVLILCIPTEKTVLETRYLFKRYPQCNQVRGKHKNYPLISFVSSVENPPWEIF